QLANAFRISRSSASGASSPDRMCASIGLRLMIGPPLRFPPSRRSAAPPGGRVSRRSGGGRHAARILAPNLSARPAFATRRSRGERSFRPVDRPGDRHPEAPLRTRKTALLLPLALALLSTGSAEAQSRYREAGD